MSWTNGNPGSTFGRMSLRLLHAVAGVCLVACRTDAPDPTPRGPAQEAATAPSVSAPAVSPLGQLEPPTATTREVAGVVAERLAAGTYSYLRVEAEGRSTWIATTGPGAALGQRVRVQSMGTRTDFYSPRLQRHFDELVFGFVDAGVAPNPSPELAPS